jgi:hypothetical protein
MVTMSDVNCDDGKSLQAKLPTMRSRKALGFRLIQIPLKTSGRRMGDTPCWELLRRAPEALVAGGTRLS